MNIQEAKLEIANTLRAYHRRDEAGCYVFPAVRQRPILLMGPPGVGKTAIMEQIAREQQVGLVAYTMTHHTRQSAIGLPHIEQKTYLDGSPVSVTTYTLSEIIASIYDCMERTGHREGILFIDEINCVSETLAPTMLQLLQNKTFGSHRIPEGWMIVAAGNPAAYNRSVREFDVATLDRVRQIDVEADLGAWRDYARNRGVHPAVLSYLSIREDQFYRVAPSAEGASFVTARGWEDLSELMKGYEELGLPVEEAQIRQYLRCGDTARGFAGYCQLYRKHASTYDIPGILDGADVSAQLSMAADAPLDERFTVVHLVLDCLDGQLVRYEWEDAAVSRLHEVLGELKLFLKDRTDVSSMGTFAAVRREALAVKLRAELLTDQECALEKWVLDRLDTYLIALKGERSRDSREGFEKVKGFFQEEVEARQKIVERIGEQLERAFRFLEQCFGEGPEMVLFVSALTGTDRAMAFISRHGCPAYLRHSGVLLYRERERALLKSCGQVLGSPPFSDGTC